MATVTFCMNKNIIIDKYKLLFLHCGVEHIPVIDTELTERNMRTIC